MQHKLNVTIYKSCLRKTYFKDHIANNLKTFKEFSPKLMVQSNGKNYMEDNGALHMPQLVLWNRLNL